MQTALDVHVNSIAVDVMSTDDQDNHPGCTWHVPAPDVHSRSTFHVDRRVTFGNAGRTNGAMT
jgi:hypothetical protein